MAKTDREKQYSPTEHKVKSGMILFSVTMLLLVAAVGLFSNYNNLLAMQEARKAAENDIIALFSQQAEEAMALAEKTEKEAPLEHDAVGALKAEAAKAIAVYTTAKEAESGIDFEAFVKTDKDMNAALETFKPFAEKYTVVLASREYFNVYDEQSGVLAYIKSAWSEFNVLIETYNTKLSLFPGNVIGNIFKLEKWTKY